LVKVGFTVTKRKQKKINFSHREPKQVFFFRRRMGSSLALKRFRFLFKFGYFWSYTWHFFEKFDCIAARTKSEQTKKVDVLKTLLLKMKGFVAAVLKSFKGKTHKLSWLILLLYSFSLIETRVCRSIYFGENSIFSLALKKNWNYLQNNN